jgi:glycosyltransferase involved in cell wall biosynthesis
LGKINSSNWISDKSRNDLVSVIIPTFDREGLLVDCIKSVFNQIYRPIECVVVDDGSTDGTFEVVQTLKQELESQDFSILFIWQVNSGAPSARNNGIRNGSGEFFQFLDSDDILYPDKIKAQVNFLKLNPSMDGVYGDWNKGEENDHLLVNGEKWDDIISQFYCGQVIHTLSFLLRREIIQKTGPWDEKLRRNQEVDYFLRAALKNGKFDYLPITTGLWRIHKGERIVTSNGAQNVLEFHEKWISEFERLNIFTEERKKVAAHNLLWHSMELDGRFKKQALFYISIAVKMYNHFPEFNTQKMKILKWFIGHKLSLKLWYAYAKRKK